MIMYRNVLLQCVNYDCVETNGDWDESEWTNVKPSLKEINPLINLPYVKENASGVIVSQSNACFLFVGRKLSLVGKTEIDLSLTEQLLCEAMDIRDSVIDQVYYSDKPMARWIKNMVVAGRSLDKLNDLLLRKYGNTDTDSSDALFFVGDEASVADFHIWEMIDQIKGMASFGGCDDPFIKFPFLFTFHARFAALPNNQRYLTSKLHALPVNNIMAKYGATPSGAVWAKGTQVHDWKGSSGSY